jgi:hypothetical protein
MEDVYNSSPLSAPPPPEANGRYRQIYGIDRPRVLEVASPRIITDPALDELLNP